MTASSVVEIDGELVDILMVFALSDFEVTRIPQDLTVHLVTATVNGSTPIR